ncbi:hypothetical protein EWI31_33090, partial [Streptomyces tsukubensis]
EAAAGKAGLTLHESFDGEFAARVRTGPYEWTRMAGIQIGGPARFSVRPAVAGSGPAQHRVGLRRNRGGGLIGPLAHAQQQP